MSDKGKYAEECNKKKSNPDFENQHYNEWITYCRKEHDINLPPPLTTGPTTGIYSTFSKGKPQEQFSSQYYGEGEFRDIQPSFRQRISQRVRDIDESLKSRVEPINISLEKKFDPTYEKLQQKIEPFQKRIQGLRTSQMLMLGLLALSISIILHLSMEQYISDKISDPNEKINTLIRGCLITFSMFVILGSAFSFSDKTAKFGLVFLIVALLEFYKLFSAIFTKFIQRDKIGKQAGFWIFGLFILIINIAFIAYDSFSKHQDSDGNEVSGFKYIGYVAGFEIFLLLGIAVGVGSMIYHKTK